MVLIQFNKHCNTHKLIPDYKSTYWEKYSYEQALVKIVNDIIWAMEHHKVTSLMAIYLSAAFDTVNHYILPSILEKTFTVHDTCLAWFESYLKPRYCMVNVREAYSSKWELVCSVPQGSLGGPILYTVYVSTMQSLMLEETDLHGFVDDLDDHVLKNSFKASNRVAERERISSLESSAADMKTWKNLNRPKMNDGKTEFIMFTSKKQLEKCVTTNIDVNGITINCSSIIKYLGTWLDQHMQLHDYIEKNAGLLWWTTEDQVPLPIINPRICSNSCQRFSHHTSWLLCNIKWKYHLDR